MSGRAFSAGHGLVEIFAFVALLASLSLGAEASGRFWTGLVLFRTVWLGIVWAGMAESQSGLRGRLERIAVAVISQLPFWLTALAVPLSPLQAELAAGAWAVQVALFLGLGLLQWSAPWANWNLLLLFWALGVFRLDQSFRPLEWLWLSLPLSLFLVAVHLRTYPIADPRESWWLGGLVATGWSVVVCSSTLGSQDPRVSEMVVLPWVCLWGVAAFLARGNQLDQEAESRRCWRSLVLSQSLRAARGIQVFRVRTAAFVGLGLLFWGVRDLASAMVVCLYLLAVDRVATLASWSDSRKAVNGIGWLLVLDLGLLALLWRTLDRGLDWSLFAVLALSALATLSCRRFALGSGSGGVVVAGATLLSRRKAMGDALRRELVHCAPVGFMARVTASNPDGGEISEDLQTRAPSGFTARLLDRIKSSSEEHRAVEPGDEL